MHRHHAGRRQQIVEHAEHRFLHFPGIARAADQDQLFGEVDRDHRFAAAAMPRGIGAETGQIDDRVIRREPWKFVGIRPYQHRADKQAVPGQFVDHAHVNAVPRLRSAVEILDEQFILTRQRREEIGLERLEMLGRHRLVGFAPPDTGFGFRVANGEFVLRRTAGMRPCFNDQRAIGGKLAFTARHRGFDERRGFHVPEDFCRGSDALSLKAQDRYTTRHVHSPQSGSRRDLRRIRMLCCRSAYLRG